MPVTEYRPIIERQLKTAPRATPLEHYAREAELFRHRFDDVGKRLVSLREGPRRYSSLFPETQNNIHDLAQLASLFAGFTKAVVDGLQCHQHEYHISLVSSRPERESGPAVLLGASREDHRWPGRQLYPGGNL
jgi:hypothetical protein